MSRVAGLALADMGGLKGRGERHTIALDGGEVAADRRELQCQSGVDGGDIEKPRRGARRRRGGSRCSGRCASSASIATRSTPASRPAVLEAQVDRLILIGEEMRAARRALGGQVALDRADSVDEATDALLRMLRPGDAVLVKASNSVGLAKLVERVVKEPAMLYLIADQLGFPGRPQPHPLHQLPRRRGERTALSIGLLLGPWFISWLRAAQGKGQPIRADGPQSHLAKRGTPTMGGLLILISVVDFGPAVDGPHQPLRLGVPAGHRRASG